MGTLQEKMQYTAGTKGLLKAAIEDKGVTVGSATFRNFAGKIAQIGGSPQKAKYEFENTQEEVSFPREALTSGYAGFFTGTTSEYFDAIQSYLQSNEVAFWGSYSDSWKVCQNSEVWANAPMVNTNFAFAFKDPVYPQEFHSRIGSTEWKLYATNDWSAFCSCLQGNVSGMETLIANGTNTNVAGGIDDDISSQTAYKYYVFTTAYSYSYVYNIALKVLTGNVKCTLSSANMTPETKVYPADYMRFVTQAWYDGTSNIASQTVVMKPYADGGALIGYIDDGSAVNLKMYLLKGTSDPVYVLSPDGTFTLPTGYSSKTLVADLDIPAHIYNNNGTWKMGGDNE